MDEDAAPEQADCSQWVASACDEIPPSSPMWALDSNALREISSYGMNQFLESLLNENPNRELQARVTMNLLQEAKWRKRKTDQRQYYEAMGTYAQTDEGKRFESRKGKYDPDHPLRVGKPLPSFEFASLDESQAPHTPEKFLGKHLLIEVWGTWCGPCIGDMGKLHEIFETLNPHGLEILSLAVSDTEEKVAEHRKTWAMPWHHSVFEDDEAMNTFGVYGVPGYILVDPKGLVLSKGPNLRGKNMMAKIRELMGVASEKIASSK